MSDRDVERAESLKVTLFHLGCLLALLGFVLFNVTGCSTDQDRSRNFDLAVKGSYNPGNATVARNQLPQGGIDEKSGVTPTKPVD